MERPVARVQRRNWLLKLLPAWVSCQAAMSLPNSANETPPSAFLGSGVQVGDGPQTDTWFIQTRVTVTQSLIGTLGCWVPLEATSSPLGANY